MILRYVVLAFLINTLFFQLGFAIPKVDCGSLPWCGSTTVSGDGVFSIIGNIISLMIQYIAVIAVIAVMVGGIMYVISSWEEEKTKKAKMVIIWALVWVFLSISAWSIINILNNFRI